MRYGDLPKVLKATPEIVCDEMMFYQYLPIKFPKQTEPIYEQRLSVFNVLVGAVCCDFIAEYGLNAYVDSYVYLTAKNLYQKAGCPFNRTGYHSDGFMTNDVNYIWYDKNPTVFNTSNFSLTMDDVVSMKEMEEQALPENQYMFPVNTILRLNQFNIHKVADDGESGLRTFVKISFSGDQYNLKGNSHNHLLNYKWEMRQRKEERNMPQIFERTTTEETVIEQYH
jgi:hypothetical protein